MLPTHSCAFSSSPLDTGANRCPPISVSSQPPLMQHDLKELFGWSSGDVLKACTVTGTLHSQHEKPSMLQHSLLQLQSPHKAPQHAFITCCAMVSSHQPHERWLLLAMNACV